jgi:uncharacterized protein DUF732
MKSALLTIVALASAGLVALAPPAFADGDSAYLSDMHDQDFAHVFPDSQLLAEGRKVCDAESSANANDNLLYIMVASDLGVSVDDGATLVGAAHGGFGC